MSGVYIKGMEMPIYGCKDCIFVNRKWHGDICPFLKREVTGNVERGGFQADCPLAPVPPHGRLIDADALKNVIQDHHDLFPADGGIFEKAERDAFQTSIGDILNAPTIIEAEESER